MAADFDVVANRGARMNIDIVANLRCRADERPRADADAALFTCRVEIADDRGESRMNVVHLNGGQLRRCEASRHDDGAGLAASQSRGLVRRVEQTDLPERGGV